MTLIKKAFICVLMVGTYTASFAQQREDKQLIALLDSIYHNDQDDRIRIEELAKRNALNSKEGQDLVGIVDKKDSVNVIKVKGILNKYGWLGADRVGVQASETIFIVIQHADVKTQEKYLPMLDEAVKNKKVSPAALAMMKDRIALRNGKKQIYGTQIGSDEKGDFYVDALEDPDNVDKRRAEVGLGLLAVYVKDWSIIWDPIAYKKLLPEIEKRDKLIIYK